MSEEDCPICRKNTANIKQKTKYDGYEFIDCSRCDKYYLKKFLPQLMNEDISNFYKVSS